MAEAGQAGSLWQQQPQWGRRLLRLLGRCRMRIVRVVPPAVPLPHLLLSLLQWWVLLWLGGGL